MPTAEKKSNECPKVAFDSDKYSDEKAAFSFAQNKTLAKKSILWYAGLLLVSLTK